MGDTITLAGSDPALEIAATLDDLIDPAEPAEFFEPPKDQRLIAVEITLRNMGSAPYDDSPENGAVLIDSESHQYTWEITASKSCQDFGGSAKIAPGDARAGCILFQVPKDATAASFQFTLDGGFGPETGVWNLS